MTSIKSCLKDFGEEIKGDILETLRKDEPLTVTAVACRADLGWKTAKKRLFELVREGKVVLREIEGGTKLFSLNREFKDGGEQHER